MQSIVAGSYRWSESADITMLNQIGISTRATGASGGYSASQMRGYLEINEKKLDESLESNLDQIKNIFGFDSDGDLIVDSGIGYSLDKQLTSWVQNGGIIANKNATINGRIKASEQKITKLENQIDRKEAQLRNKYGQMEGTLNSLNSQSNTISNFANSGKQQ
jgi:flagellar hook-associated protein 2